MTVPVFRLVLCALALRGLSARAHVIQGPQAPPPAPERTSEGLDPAEGLRSCWAGDAASCETAVAGLMGRADDVLRLSEFATLERVNASEGAGAERGRAAGEGAALSQVGLLLSSRALKLNLWEVAELGVRRAPGQPDSLEVSLDYIEHSPEGSRSTRRMTKVIIPLVLGFKLTGALILAVTVVKIFLVKAFVVSKIALLAALYMMIRKLMTAVGVQHHPYLYSQHKLPAYSLDAGYPVAAASEYYGYPAGYYGGPDYAPYAAAVDGGPGPGLGDDLQGHFSNNNNNVQAAPPATARNGTKMVSRTDGLKHTVYGLVKSSAHRVPVNTYRKLVTTGRKLAS